MNLTISFFYLCLEKASVEKKTLILLGDFNIDLLKCENNSNHSNFLDILCSHSILPTILLPTRITSSSKTLIDNIFISSSKYDLTAGNIISCISDHLPQFLFFNTIGSQPFSQNKTIKYDWNKFNREDFILEYLNVDWEVKLKLEDSNVNFNEYIFIYCHWPSWKTRTLFVFIRIT